MRSATASGGGASIHQRRRQQPFGQRPDHRHGDGIAHQKLLNDLSNTDLLIIDDFLTVGIDHDAASDLFAILANREHRLPTMIAAQSGPGYWVEALPDRVAADSIVNRLANHARTINLGTIDMRRIRHDHTRASTDYWE